ncbi:MAG: DUF4326 domain-containing protein [Microbacteriaceae bacterium]
MSEAYAAYRGSMPHRFQLSRHRGWRMPENGVSVARPRKWGNPFPVGAPGIPDRQTAVERFRQLAAGEITLDGTPYPFDQLDELRGHDLGCWCSLDGPCHGDVLLELANR